MQDAILKASYMYIRIYMKLMRQKMTTQTFKIFSIRVVHINTLIGNYIPLQNYKLPSCKVMKCIESLIIYSHVITLQLQLSMTF